jgi:uncharacterized membrane protein YhiD involved in acid resistance
MGLSHVDILIRIGLAALVGIIIGWEREHVNRPAGLRTYALVCVGSALFTVLSIDAFGAADPSRVAAQIIAGIGFLGAGTIFKFHDKVMGLTTAAGLWAVAGVGMGFGAGYYFATGVTAVIIFALFRFYKSSPARKIVEHEVDEIKQETKKFTHQKKTVKGKIPKRVLREKVTEKTTAGSMRSRKK